MRKVQQKDRPSVFTKSYKRLQRVRLSAVAVISFRPIWRWSTAPSLAHFVQKYLRTDQHASAHPSSSREEHLGRSQRWRPRTRPSTSDCPAHSQVIAHCACVYQELVQSGTVACQQCIRIFEMLTHRAGFSPNIPDPNTYTPMCAPPPLYYTSL